MHPTRKKKLTRIASGFTLFLIIFNMLIPFSYATQWSPDTRLTWHESLDWAPSIAQAQDGRIWVVWHSYEVGRNPDIFYKVYNGSSTFPWSPIKRLTTNPDVDKTPSITAAGGNIWVVWSSNRDGKFEIYYKICNGSLWSPDQRLTMDSSKDEWPSVMEDKNGDIWVVWSSDRTGNFEIYYQVFDNKKKEWQPCGQLTSNSRLDWDPSIMQAQDGRIWIVWARDDDLFYKVISVTKIGEDFQLVEEVGDTPLTGTDSNTDWHPSIIQAQDSRIWIAWDSCALADMEIYCKIYDGTWLQERITYNDADDLMPAIIQATDGTIWITWTSNRLDNFDIYYRTDSPPQHLHDIAMISATHDPNITVAYQGLNVSIEVVPQNQGVKDEYVQVNCYADSTRIGSLTVHLSAGQLTPLNFTWNTSKVVPNTYTIIANASILGETDTDPADNTLSESVIQVRIPGDADFSGLVEMYDFVLWADNIGKVADQFPSAVYPDFDNSGFVEMADFYRWRENIGRHYP